MRKCQDCGATTDKVGRGRVLCLECKAAHRDRPCVFCGRTCHETRTVCERCRNEKYTGKCHDCGKRITGRAFRCSACHVKLHTKRGPQSPNWKGGTFTSSRGYVYVQQNGRQRTQHRVIMEELLGRSLLPGESVHHINGQRGDNRPENLELWSTAHPAGQRVKDLVAWAKVILHRYKEFQG